MPIEGIPNIITIGVPSKKHLTRVEQKLIDNAIDHVAWEEPDYEFGMTAIATVPLSGEQRVPLANYRLWQPISLPSLEIRANGSNRETLANNQREAPTFPCSSVKEQPAGHKPVGRSEVQVLPGEPLPQDPVAQLAERRILIPRVVGSSPTGISTPINSTT